MSFKRESIVAIGAIVLLPPLMGGCNDHSLTNLLNGGSSSATTPSTEPTPYMTGNKVTPAQLNQLKNYAPGQTTLELRHILKSPDSYTRSGDFYRTETGGMVEIPYDDQGRWTGEVKPAPSPTWNPAPYPGGAY